MSEMTDYEMLELAAKAAGYQIEWVKNSGCYYRCEEKVGREQWDPLDNDGDALRLAVKVGMQFEVRVGVAAPNTVVWIAAPGEIVVRHLDDPDAATRLAIVRAAAKIGSALK